MKKKNDVTLQEAMQAMLRQYKLSARLNESRIKSLWSEVMGKTIATYTTEIEVRKNILYLTILSAPLRQELSYAKDQIKNRLNEELGEEFIQEVIIR
jgi:predicted nucleic acid-binding Zn ribbon protein